VLASRRGVQGASGAAECEHRDRQGATLRDGYARRRPEETALYQCIAQHWPGFVERLEEQGGLPKFVKEEFEQYLTCGRLEFGCLELQCRRCGHSELVAFSCKYKDSYTSISDALIEAQLAIVANAITCGQTRVASLNFGSSDGEISRTRSAST